MVQGRSKQVFKAWLGERDTSWRDGIEVVAMDGFTGFKTATNEELPDAVAVMDPFHVVRLAGDALDQCRRRIQQATCGHRGRSMPRGAPCTPDQTCSPTSNANG
jgi:transposase